MLRFLLFIMFLLISFAPVMGAVKLKNNRLIGITAVTGLLSILIIPWIIGAVLVGRQLPENYQPRFSFGVFAGFWAVMLAAFLFLPFLSYGFGTLNGYQLFSLAGYGGDGSGLILLFLAALAGAAVASLFLRGRRLFTGEMIMAFAVSYTYFFLGFSSFAVLDAFASMLAAFGVYFQFIMIFAAIAFLYYMSYHAFDPAPHTTVHRQPAAGTTPRQAYRQPQNRPAPAPAVSYPQKPASLKIRCVRGEYEGAEFQLKQKEHLILGTDPEQVNLIFSSPEISRLHCSILCTDTPGKVRITDFSSNGTYLSDGTRLPAGTPAEYSLPCTVFFGNLPQTFEITGL
ncbi:FHA domain-containing protein [Fusibacillus kribbianus]|uniref:FHA domain-containing protein n=1 Tax=Fusibacillus kribbianus TaxID=3044208 RepID=A0AAP4EYX9_9FIRM|nr:FHA domain-containing protein [Ruminococcus sp. YH-rum2234]MDI9241135.1 FHA domain-containing protein [Ruminococcus sp. YH-rum2234]